MKNKVNPKETFLEQAIAYLDSHNTKYISFLKEIAKIPSPTFSEHTKALFLQKKLKSIGIQSTIDEKGNVRGKISSQRKGAKNIFVSAHIDTVMPCTGEIKETDEFLYGHGVCDNSAGVTSLFSILELMKKYKLSYVHNFYFSFTVQEEGLGSKNGMKYALAHLPSIDVVINLESHNVGRVTNQCVGQYRVKISVETKSGGHAFREFGHPNAIVILAKFIDAWSMTAGFQKNITTYNVGKITGGEGINSIATHAEILMEIRSIDQKVLVQLIKKLQTLIRVINKKNKDSNITTTVLSQTKAAAILKNHSLYTHVTSIQKHLGITSVFDAGNTDGDVPLSKNIPTVTIGTSIGFKTHSMDEYMNKKSLSLGMKQNFLVVMDVLDTY